MKTIPALLLSMSTSVLALAMTPTSTLAYRLYFGEDLHNNAFTPLFYTPNAATAQRDFLSGLVGVGVETFEGFYPGTGSPLYLNFGTAGVATLQGNGRVSQVTPGTTNRVGRYAVSGQRFWEGEAAQGGFNINFSKEVAAFGFHGVDIGDFGGQLSLILNLARGGQQTVTVPNAIGSWGSTDGSVLYFGLIADNDYELFTGVSFQMTSGQGDFFAFDNMTIGSKEQVIPPAPPPPPPAPEPVVTLPELELPEPEPVVVLPELELPEPVVTLPKSVVSTPEPAAVLGLLGLGVLGVGSRIQRKSTR